MSRPLATRPSSARRSRRELLRIDGRAVEVTMRLNPRARRLIVKVHPSTGEISVIAPSQRALDRALDFAQGEAPWIARQLARVPTRIVLAPGQRIPFLGREHLIVKSGSGPTAHDAEACVIRVGGRDEHAPRRLTDFLKREARRVLEARSHAFAARIDAKVRRVTVRDTASRWGSCSANKSISYCWRLILAPEFVTDYVVAHEVAHLREMNHGPRFWRLVRTLVDDIESPQLWLKKNGTALHRYGA
ncbi:MAG TPA: SprT family zinc-dependent metalloprotease [Rhizomicrobium sp.]|jgi:predicted metal-dependent hydrolase|nr:SprT family zinc-dependent metalloprotease [Rhizomicrobium sp.]